MATGIERLTGGITVILFLAFTVAGAMARDAWAASGPVASAASAAAATPVSPDALASRQMEALDRAQVNRLLDEINRETAPYLPALSLDRLWGLLRGEDGGWHPANLARGLLRYFLGELLRNAGLLAKLVVLAVLAAVLYNLQASFADAAVARAAYGVVFIALVGLALVSFHQALQMAQGTLDRLSTFMLATLPLLITLLAASGNVVSAGLFHPLVIAVVQVTNLLVTHWVFPLLMMAALVELATAFSENLKLSGLASLLRQGGMVALGLGLALFLGVMTVQGVGASIADGVTLRTAKYLAKSFVPVVGGMFSDATELVATSTLLLRNGVGVVGLLAVLFSVALPFVKLIALILIYRLAAAAIQPMGGGALVASLNGLAGSLTLVSVTVGAVAILFFLAIAALVGAGNLAVMLR